MAVFPTKPDAPEGESQPQLPVPTAQPGYDEGLNRAASPKISDFVKIPSLDALKAMLGGFGFNSDDVVIALGSENVYVASRELPEPAAYSAYVAMSKANKQVIALGDKARAMLGREPQNIEVVPLLLHGVPENPDLFASFLQRVMAKHFKKGLSKPRILCAGNFHNPLLKKICSQGLFELRSRDILFCEPEIAGAVGMGLNILEPSLKSVMIFERDWIGFMVISMSGSLTRVRLNLGFDHLLEDIQIYFEESNEFAPREEDLGQQFRAQGFTGTQNLIGWEAWVNQVERGKPVKLEASSAEYQKAVTPTLLRVKHSVNRSLEELTREQRYTVQTTPTFLAGEYADLPGLKELLERVFGREFRLANNPKQTMAAGLLALVPDIETLQTINGGGGEVEM